MGVNADVVAVAAALSLALAVVNAVVSYRAWRWRSRLLVSLVAERTRIVAVTQELPAYGPHNKCVCGVPGMRCVIHGA